MRKLLTLLVVGFIKILTMNLNDVRRSDVIRRVRSRLVAELSIITSSGRRILFDNTMLINNAIKYMQKTETDTIAWIESMPEDAVLWDIGANIGFFSLHAASKLNRSGVHVVGFEPAAASYSTFNRNIEINGMADDVVAYCIALAGVTRIGRLNMGAIGSGTTAGGWANGFESEIDGLDRDIDTVFRQGSVGFSIDDFVKMFQPPLPTHVKMDVDGIEAEILRGGSRTLSASSVRSMIIEMEGDLDSERNREVFSLMDELGFVPKPRQSPELRNVIFERPA